MQHLALEPTVTTDTQSTRVSANRLTESRRLAITLAVVAILVDCTVLLGWVLDYVPLVRITPGMPGMSAWTATGFLIAAGALLGFQDERIDHWTYRASMWLSFGLVLFSVCGLINFELVDQNLMALDPEASTKVSMLRMPLNRISPNTCVTFFLLGLALLLIDRPLRPNKGSSKQWPFQMLACVVALEGVVTFIGEIFGIARLEGFAGLIGTAIQTSALFVMLSIGVLLSRPTRGITGVILSDSLPGRSARTLLPVAVIAPIALGGITLLVIRLHSPNALLFAFAIIVCSMMVLAAMIWGTVMALYKQVEISQEYELQIAELERSKIEGALKTTQDRLEVALIGAGLGAWQWDIATGMLLWSDQCKAIFGLPSDADLTIDSMTQCIHPDDRQMVQEFREAAIERHADYATEYRIVWPDGSVHWISTRGRASYDRNGEVLTLEGVVQDVTDQRASLKRQHLLIRDVLSSATDGRLVLCVDPDDLPAPLDEMSAPIVLSRDNGVAEIRRRAREAAHRVGFPEDRRFDLETAVGEAAMNAVVHASVGTGRVFAGESGIVQVWIEDQGGGISLENLPKATLKKGYTTAGTLGHGMKLMLQTVDRLYLLTGSGGTTVVLEKEAEEQTVAIF